MNATIIRPPTPAATVTLVMTERQAQLLGCWTANVRGMDASVTVNQNSHVSTTPTEMAALLSETCHALRNAKMQ